MLFAINVPRECGDPWDIKSRVKLFHSPVNNFSSNFCVTGVMCLQDLYYRQNLDAIFAVHSI